MADRYAVKVTQDDDSFWWLGPFDTFADAVSARPTVGEDGVYRTETVQYEGSGKQELDAELTQIVFEDRVYHTRVG